MPPDSSLATPTAAATTAIPVQPGPLPAPTAKRPRLYILDGLRLLAALAVLSWHYAGIERDTAVWGGKAGTYMPTLHRVANYGWVGVEMFFLISGFVICMSSWGRPLGSFVSSRITRLFPAYWFSVLFLAALAFAVHVPWNKDLLKGSYSNVITNLTMVQEGTGGLDVDGVYWTLWIELRFYVLFGLMAIGGVTYRKVMSFCCGWLLLALLASATGWKVLDVLFFPRYAPFFIAGVALYLLHRYGGNLLVWGLIGFCWMQAQNQLRFIVADYYWQKVSYNVAFALVTLAFLVMIGVAVGWFDRIQWKWLVSAGALTYPLYLVHEQFGWQVIRHFHSRYNAYALVGVLTVSMLVFAWLIHRLVERPASAALRRGLARAFDDVREIGNRERAERRRRA
ncbi:acyltransferase family protein [Kitasatospora phosalacinea]|uniref:Acyltransferase n=1 Tax=Kitasatospora phosalacinea TaxID=2065 RepID=A0A9W6PII8_9ACTN|nr:acyltransferase [Kitasatospora phosalacinea]GLW55564.1 acyltransferase [Kitasatospora phosalacinea]